MTRLASAWLCVAALAACGGSGGGSGTPTVPGDTTPPTVLGTTPSSAATNVATSTAVSVQFSEAMKRATVAVTLSPAATLGAPAWSAGDTLVTLTPTSPLAAGTTYSVAVSGQDLAGNALAFPGRTFTTATTAALAAMWDAAIWDQGLWQ
jgi:hypothetical protein